MTAQVTLVGTLGQDPELRYTPSGAAVANFSMAVNRRWKNRQTDEWEEETSWFRVTCWRDLAQNVAESVVKGSRVIVVGRLEQRSWTTDGGEKRSVIEVQGDEIGPSLRWATADIERTERTDRSAASGPSGGGGQQQHPVAAYDPGEEPFASPDPFLLWEQSGC